MTPPSLGGVLPMDGDHWVSLPDAPACRLRENRQRDSSSASSVDLSFATLMAWLNAEAVPA